MYVQSKHLEMLYFCEKKANIRHVFSVFIFILQHEMNAAMSTTKDNYSQIGINTDCMIDY